jgi:hypothetical protein
MALAPYASKSQLKSFVSLIQKKPDERLAGLFQREIRELVIYRNYGSLIFGADPVLNLF